MFPSEFIFIHTADEVNNKVLTFLKIFVTVAIILH